MSKFVVGQFVVLAGTDPTMVDQIKSVEFSGGHYRLHARTGYWGDHELNPIPNGQQVYRVHFKGFDNWVILHAANPNEAAFDALTYVRDLEWRKEGYQELTIEDIDEILMVVQP